MEKAGLENYLWLDTAEHCALWGLNRTALSSICGESLLSALFPGGVLALSKVWEQKSVPSKLRHGAVVLGGVLRGTRGIQSGKDWLGSKLQQLVRFEELVIG